MTRLTERLQDLDDWLLGRPQSASPVRAERHGDLVENAVRDLTRHGGETIWAPLPTWPTALPVALLLLGVTGSIASALTGAWVPAAWFTAFALTMLVFLTLRGRNLHRTQNSHGGREHND